MHIKICLSSRRERSSDETPIPWAVSEKAFNVPFPRPFPPRMHVCYESIYTRYQGRVSSSNPLAISGFTYIYMFAAPPPSPPSPSVSPAFTSLPPPPYHLTSMSFPSRSPYPLLTTLNRGSTTLPHKTPTQLYRTSVCALGSRR